MKRRNERRNKSANLIPRSKKANGFTLCKNKEDIASCCGQKKAHGNRTSSTMSVRSNSSMSRRAKSGTNIGIKLSYKR